jgi:inosine triphosphate pyrophosphatase
MTKPNITFVTGNANKLAEVRQILGDSVELTSANVDVPEIQGTIDEITAEKCRRAAEIVSVLCLKCGFERKVR